MFYTRTGAARYGPQTPAAGRRAKIKAVAAASEHRPIPLLELRDVNAGYLEPVLSEETAEWRADLDWDFAPSADLVRRFVGMRALTGFVLPGSGSAAGYAYYVLDEGKGLIGGLYVSPSYRTEENENALISGVLEAMWRVPGTRRVEAQLMMLSSPLDRDVPYPRWFQQYPRRFLEMSLDCIDGLPPRDPAVSISPWSESRQEEAARVIASAYAGHIDSQINDQYRSSSGARRFLTNIVQYPGCGSFFAPGSFVASSGGHSLHGLCLASMVADGVGHITQVCVTPSHRGAGLGYELLRRSLVSLAAHGCQKVSLTVTDSNTAAIRVYERMGFQSRRGFAAYVWEIR
jgi:ribosomal protein S18 acetylase RimI-like enzyme